MPTTQSPNLNLPLVQAAQSQKHVTVNQSLLTLDTLSHLTIISANETLPPTTPDNGDRYLIPSGATGEWAGNENNIAVWQDNTWLYFPPRTGWRVWNIDQEVMLIWSNENWTSLPISSAEIQNIELLGVNTQADTTNKLSVQSSSVLLSTDNEDLRLILNKDTDQDIASIIFQSDNSGRAEVGITGNNDLTVKTSTDGSNWQETLAINNSDNELNLNSPLSLYQTSKSSLPDYSQPGRIIYVTDATGGPCVAYSDCNSWKRISDNTTIN